MHPWNKTEELTMTGFNIPTTYNDALLYAVDLQEQADNLQDTVDEMATYKEALNEFTEHEEVFNLRSVFKALGVPEKQGIRALLYHRILYRGRFDKLLPYSTYQHKGFFEVALRSDDGSTHVQTMVTTAGVAFLSQNKRKFFL